MLLQSLFYMENRPKTGTRVCIFFDFDGVIADSLSIAFEINKISKPSLTLEKYQSFFNGNINETKSEEEFGPKVNFFEEYGKRFEKLDIDEQKQLIIQKLSERFPLFIISSTTSDIIRTYLRKHQILSCFKEILGNEIHASKVKKFRLLFEKYHIDPKDVIFITDSTGDMIEAKEAGIETIVGILGGYQNEENLKRENPTIIVKDFLQFYEFVQSQSKT